MGHAKHETKTLEYNCCVDTVPSITPRYSHCANSHIVCAGLSAAAKGSSASIMQLSLAPAHRGSRRQRQQQHGAGLDRGVQGHRSSGGSGSSFSRR
jgi:hypothetical protein